ncbi:MAG: VanW family protein, partial [Clostridia bacterium]|nr:VanW family protein [Clostridia bacterium]
NKNKKTAVFVIAVFVVLLVFALSVFKTTAYRGVSVAGIPVGGKTEKEIQVLLEKELGEKLPEISVSVGENTLKIPFEEIASVDYKKTAEHAIETGRSNCFIGFWTYVTPFVDRNTDIIISLDEVKLYSYLDQLESTLENAYKRTTVVAGEESIEILTGHAGAGIDYEQVSQQILNQLVRNEDAHITAKLTDKAFNPNISDEELNRIKSKPTDAYYDAENKKIVPHTFGYELDKKEVLDILKNAKPDTGYSIPVKSIAPEKTTEDVEKEMFGDLLGTYTTTYNAGQTDRSYNVALAASKFNGYIMDDGDVFSYNDTVGERSLAAGFRNAAVYTSNGVENGVGGGVCQPSTTLYNAVLKANLEIVYRKNHSYPVSYAPKGQDATVVWGAVDFKFKNNTGHPIYIKTSVGGGNCVVSIYGKKTKNFSVEIVNTTISTKPYTTEYTDDPEMEAGKEKTTRDGITGYEVRSVRRVTIDGKTTEEKLPASSYRMLPKKVTRGVKETGEETQPSESGTETEIEFTPEQV